MRKKKEFFKGKYIFLLAYLFTYLLPESLHHLSLLNFLFNNLSINF